MFDHAGTFRALFPKILRGYALDALGAHDNRLLLEGPRMSLQTRARRLLKRTLGASRQQFLLQGLGETWRLVAPNLSGGGVSLDDRVVHFSAFQSQEERYRMSRNTSLMGYDIIGDIHWRTGTVSEPPRVGGLWPTTWHLTVIEMRSRCCHAADGVYS